MTESKWRQPKRETLLVWALFGVRIDRSQQSSHLLCLHYVLIRMVHWRRKPKKKNERANESFVAVVVALGVGPLQS